MDTLPEGKSSKSPAFSFYAKEWLAATLSWALDARGAYATLLAYQWDAGSVPGGDMAALGRVLGVSTPKARLVWAVVASKFERGDDGLWRNVRLEQERQKQTARSAALKANGARGGRPPNQRVNQNETNRFSETEPNENLNKSLTSSSSSSGKNVNTQTAPASGHGNGAFTPGSLPRDHRFHAICSPRFRLCLTETTAAKLIRKWGGDEVAAKVAVTSFVESLEREVGDGPTGDHLWLTQHFEVFMEARGRAPVAPPKPKPANGTVMDQIDAWGRDDQN